MIGQWLGSQHGVLHRGPPGGVVRATRIHLGAEHLPTRYLHDVHHAGSGRHAVRAEPVLRNRILDGGQVLAQLARVAAIRARLPLIGRRQVRQAIVLGVLQVLQLLLGLLLGGVGLLRLGLRRVELLEDVVDFLLFLFLLLLLLGVELGLALALLLFLQALGVLGLIGPLLARQA